MAEENKKSIVKSGENEISIQPQKVEKLEADEYLLEKAIKAQENAIEKMRRQHLMHLAQERNHQHNKIRRKRKITRQNRRGGRYANKG